MVEGCGGIIMFSVLKGVSLVWGASLLSAAENQTPTPRAVN